MADESCPPGLNLLACRVEKLIISRQQAELRPEGARKRGGKRDAGATWSRGGEGGGGGAAPADARSPSASAGVWWGAGAPAEEGALLRRDGGEGGAAGPAAASCRSGPPGTGLDPSLLDASGDESDNFFHGLKAEERVRFTAREEVVRSKGPGGGAAAVARGDTLRDSICARVACAIVTWRDVPTWLGDTWASLRGGGKLRVTGRCLSARQCRPMRGL